MTLVASCSWQKHSALGHWRAVEREIGCLKDDGMGWQTDSQRQETKRYFARDLWQPGGGHQKCKKHELFVFHRTYAQ